jgi:hypothetical protein
MNYLQRFSSALAAWETRRRSQGMRVPVDSAEHDANSDWLGEIQAVARRLPPTDDRGAGNDD